MSSYAVTSTSLWTRRSPELVATAVATYAFTPMSWAALGRKFGVSVTGVRHWWKTYSWVVDAHPGASFDELVAAIMEAVKERKRQSTRKQTEGKRASMKRAEQDMDELLASHGVDVELLKSIPRKVPGLGISSAPDLKKMTRDADELLEIIHQQELLRAVVEERQKLLEEKITRLGKGQAPIRGVKDLTRIALAVIARGFTVAETLGAVGLASSSFYYTRTRLEHPGLARRARLAAQVIEICEQENYRVGYRIVHAIVAEMGQRVSEKIVREIMAEFDLSPKLKRRRKYSSYKGESAPAAPNRLYVATDQGRAAHQEVVDLSARFSQSVDSDGRRQLTHDFHADAPMQKWVTDISEIPCKDGKLYLSPVIDVYDMFPVSVMVGNRPSMALVTEMIQDAIDQLAPGQRPIIHSDRGFHYRAKQWFKTITRTGSDTPAQELDDWVVVPSMSRKATSGDNAAMEGFFGVLKREAFYYHDINTRELTRAEVTVLLDEYLTWYVYNRRFKRLGYTTLASHRGLAPHTTSTAA